MLSQEDYLRQLIKEQTNERISSLNTTSQEKTVVTLPMEEKTGVCLQNNLPTEESSLRFTSGSR